MAVGPIEHNGAIQRSQDIGIIKQQEDNKPLTAQQNAMQQIKKQEQILIKNVTSKENAALNEHRYDAKEKGSNGYEAKKNKKRKKKQEGRVIRKEENTHFDIKI